MEALKYIYLYQYFMFRERRERGISDAGKTSQGGQNPDLPSWQVLGRKHGGGDAQDRLQEGREDLSHTGNEYDEGREKDWRTNWIRERSMERQLEAGRRDRTDDWRKGCK